MRFINTSAAVLVAVTMLAGVTIAGAQSIDDPPGSRFQDRGNADSNGIEYRDPYSAYASGSSILPRGGYATRYGAGARSFDDCVALATRRGFTTHGDTYRETARPFVANCMAGRQN